MIDRRELMQGNLVKPIGYLYEMKPIEYCIVDGFSDDGVFIDGIRGMGLLDYSEIEPIPITPEWLERMGFEFYDGVQACWPEGVMTLGNYKDGWKYNPTGSLTIARGCYQYIHQIQNLYYALTGEELQIKEKTN